MGAERIDPAPRGDIEGLLAGGPDESLFRAHFENLPGPAYIWRRVGSDFRLIACNRAATERVRTIAHEFAIGCSAAALQGDQYDFVGFLHRCVQNGRVEHGEFEYRYRSGVVRRLNMTVMPIGPDHVVHHTQDITERHYAEQALRTSEARFRALMQAHPDMLVRVTRDGVYLDAHVPEKVTRLLGFRAEHFIGKRVDEIFDREFARMHERYRLKALETEGVHTWEFTRTVDGQRRDVEARFVRSGEDEVMITITDVTDRLHLEREIVSSVERERNHIGHDLHDGLGQLLTGVKLMLEPLRKKLPADASAEGKTLHHAVELINQAIAQTSELARGLSPVHREPGLTLDQVLQQLAKRSEAYFGITCRVRAAARTDRLSEECANNLYRIAQEAVTNAVRHGRASEVDLSCRLEPGGVTMTIEDNGTGFHGTKSPAGGMGMHIMRYRARAVGGELKAENRPGRGAIISCFCPFPRAEAANEAAAGRAATPRGPGPA